MRQVGSLAEIEWIENGVRQIAPNTSATVAHCIPPIYSAYAKVLHPIYNDLSITDDDLTWQADSELKQKNSEGLPSPLREALNRSTLVYGAALPQSRLVRLPWAELAQCFRLPLTPTSSAETFTRQFQGRSWPRHLVGPAEGYLDSSEREALILLLRPHTNVQRCLFHLWFLATQDWKDDLFFEGPLDDVLLFPDRVHGARLTPTHWFPEDRGWLVCTDYDLTFSLVGGSDELVRDLLNSSDLECMPVQPESRVANNADSAATRQ